MMSDEQISRCMAALNAELPWPPQGFETSAEAQAYERRRSLRFMELLARGEDADVPAGEPDWKAVALECLAALRKSDAFYRDLSDSNPGFMARLVVQDYQQWNESRLLTSIAVMKYKGVEVPGPVKAEEG